MKTINKIFGAFLLLGLLQSCAKPPKADFIADVPANPAPVAVKFENSSTDADSYQWIFGDGNESTEAAPTHTYNTFGDIAVQLIATKADKSDTITKTIKIMEPPRRYALVETEYGNMKIYLYNNTPGHRDNFIKLANEGFYDDLLFHRVIEGFMIQGGDPNSRGASIETPLGGGGPGYQIPAEFVKGNYHKKGALAAARTGDAANPEKKSSGSQFYIVQGQKMTEQMLAAIMQQKNIMYSQQELNQYLTTGGYAPLDGDYTVYGEVVEGLEVIDKIAAVEKGPQDRPAQDVKMKISMIE